VSTTHGTGFVLGVEPRTLLEPGGGPYIKDLAIHFWDRAQTLSHSYVDRLDPQRVKTKDVRAERYYNKHFNGPNTPGINALLYVFYALLNFVDSMLTLEDTPESRRTVLKVRFLALYHISSSLRRLRAERSADLGQRSLGFMNRNLNNTKLDSLTQTSSSRHFRNTLIHYGLAPDVQERDLIPDVPFYGLVEKYFPGDDNPSLSKAVGDEICRVVDVFNAWV